MVGTVDVLLGNLGDAIKSDNKVAAREGGEDRPEHRRSRRAERADPAVDAHQRPRQPLALDDPPRWSRRSATSSTS